MPIALPGLFDIVSGRASSINNQLSRLQVDEQATSNYLNTLNAFNASLNTNDNLQFREAFAAQPVGTPILDKLDAISLGSTNPFLTNQAVINSQQLAPLLAQRSLQSQLFGATQGLPASLPGLTNAGFFGVNPIFQQQTNDQIQQLFTNAGTGLNAARIQGAALDTSRAGLATDLGAAQQARAAAENQQLRAELAELRRLLGARPAAAQPQLPAAQTTTAPATPQPSATPAPASSIRLPSAGQVGLPTQ